MSRWEVAEDSVSSTLKGKVSSVELDAVSGLEAQIGFIKSWYQDTDHREILSALMVEGFEIMTWTVSRHKSGGVRVTLRLRDLWTLLEAHPEFDGPVTVGVWTDPRIRDRYLTLSPEKLKELFPPEEA